MRSELHDEVKAFVEQVVEAMGLDVAIEVSDLEDGSVRVDVQGEEGELLLRRKGEGLDALQHLVNSAYRRDVGRDQRIVIDAMNFRQGKDIELQQMAKFLIEKVRTTGVAQELGPAELLLAPHRAHGSEPLRRRRLGEPGRRPVEAGHHQPAQAGALAVRPRIAARLAAGTAGAPCSRPTTPSSP